MTFKKFVIFSIGAVLAAISFMSFSGSAHATALLQNSEGQKKADPQNNEAIDQAALEEFIKTLENEKQREAFISNLKTLQDINAQKQAEADKKESLPPVLKSLPVKEQLQSFTSKYEDFLKSNDLSKGFVGKSALSLVAAIVFLIVLRLFRQVSRTVRKNLNKIKTRYNLYHKRFDFYAETVRYAGDLLALFLVLFTIAVIWNLEPLAFVQSHTARAVIGILASIFVIVLVAVLVWETLYTLSEKYVQGLDTGFDTRIQTLLPLIRNVFLILLATMTGFVVLSELGVDIMPLLAGAGVVGIAVGFGAQTMVRDFLNGFFIILEDLIQIGDVVELAGRRGVVEQITIRKIRMRALDGTVCTIPFSEVRIIENLTKEFSYYLMEVGVAYRENTDDVISHLRAVDEELRNDDELGPFIREPIDIMGVDKFADSAVVIKARIKTEPSKQWKVGREYNRRMKQRFDEVGIEIPFPHQTLYFGVDKDGSAPAANVNVTSKVNKADGKNRAKKA